jgi:ribonuclease BN (tRNA processing enzyme)
MKYSGPDISRRRLLGGVAAGSAIVLAAAPGAARAENFETAFEAESARVQAALEGTGGTKLVLLGTGGGPAPGQARHMTAHLMLHDGAAYILDCGMGVTDQFARTGTSFAAVRAIFITHHHLDHNIEYGPFLLVGWTRGLGQSVRAYGPPPLRQMTQDFLRSYQATIDFWAEDLKLQPFGMIEVHDLAAMGPVMQDEHVKVTSVLVQHPPVKPAYGYRFDFADRSIAFSGDTVPLAAVARLARGADVLVHEAINMAAIEQRAHRMIAEGSRASFESIMHHMRVDHSPTEDVGRIAQEAGVKTLVLSHLSPSEAAGGDETWRAPAARYFKGRIIVGHDLMVV